LTSKCVTSNGGTTTVALVELVNTVDRETAIAMFGWYSLRCTWHCPHQ